MVIWRGIRKEIGKIIRVRSLGLSLTNYFSKSQATCSENSDLINQ